MVRLGLKAEPRASVRLFHASVIDYHLPLATGASIFSRKPSINCVNSDTGAGFRGNDI